MAPLPLMLRIFALVFAVQSFAVGVVADPQEACSHTQHPDLCVQSLLTYPESRTADNHQLAGLAIRFAAKNGAETVLHILTLIQDLNRTSPSTNPGLDQCLNDCSEHLINAIEQLDTSTAALDKRAYGDLDTWVAAAVADATSCNEGCEQHLGKETEAAELKKKADEFMNLCGIALDLSKHADK